MAVRLTVLPERPDRAIGTAVVGFVMSSPWFRWRVHGRRGAAAGNLLS